MPRRLTDSPTRPAELDEIELVILGKPTIRKAEYDALHVIGRCVARRNKPWKTTATSGAPRAILDGYEYEIAKQGYENQVSYIPKGSKPPDHNKVMVFTDSKFQKLLDEALPDWRERDWYIVHNQKDTQVTAKTLAMLAEEIGSPLTLDDDSPYKTKPYKYVPSEPKKR